MANRTDILRALREHRPELQAIGVRHAALFGSIARGDADVDSDIDLLVDLAPDEEARGFAYFGRLERIREIASRLLGRKVDLVVAPVRKPHLRQEIDRERIDAF